MNEVAFIVIAALPVNKYVLIGAILVLAVVLLGGGFMLFRNPGKKRGGAGKADASAGNGAAGWQSGQQPQQAAWGQQPQQAAWGQQPQQAAWGQQPQQAAWGQPQQGDSWGAQNPASQPGAWGQPGQQPQQAAWGAPPQAAGQQPGAWGAPPQQPQANVWGNPTSNTPSGGAGQGANPNAWGDATFMPQQAAPAAQDAWGGQPQAQAAPAWGAPAQSQPQAPTAYGGGSGQSWGQANQPAASPDPWNMGGQQAPAQQGWGQPAQQPPAPAAGVNPAMPSWQQGPNAGQAFGSPFGGSENDKTMLRPNSPMGTLGVVRVEEGKEPGRVYEVRKDELSIGRSRESDIFLEDLAVSRLHAKILNLGNGNYALKDEGSANGTKVNGQLVNKYQTYPLQEGDKIQLGQTVLVFARR